MITESTVCLHLWKDSDRIRVFVWSLFALSRSQDSLSAVQNIVETKQFCQFTRINIQSSNVFVNGQSLSLQLHTRCTVLKVSQMHNRTSCKRLSCVYPCWQDRKERVCNSVLPVSRSYNTLAVQPRPLADEQLLALGWNAQTVSRKKAKVACHFVFQISPSPIRGRRTAAADGQGRAGWSWAWVPWDCLLPVCRQSVLTVMQKSYNRLDVQEKRSTLDQIPRQVVWLLLFFQF